MSRPNQEAMKGEERSIWTLPELSKASGVEYRTLHSWVKRGLLTPSIRPMNGSGVEGLFSDDDLLHACVLGALRPLLTMEGLALIGSDR